MHAARAEQDETVMVGDSHIDLRTARAAGVRFCLAGYGFGVEQMPEGLLSPDDLIARAPSTCWTCWRYDDGSAPASPESSLPWCVFAPAPRRPPA